MSTTNNSGSTEAYADEDEMRYDSAESYSAAVAGEEEKEAKKKMIMEWWRQARENQAVNRLEQALDRDYYDGLQLTDEERQELMDRGQPPITKNLIKSSVDWIIGTEKRTRMDFHVYPRKDDESANDRALVKTKLLKYNMDVNKAQYARSRAFEDAVITGVGWLEDGVSNDSTRELSFSGWESWRNVWYDHLNPHHKQWRYIFRQRWTDYDVAEAMFPDKKEELKRAVVSHNTSMSDDDEFFALSQVYQQYDSQGYSISRSLGNESWNVNNRRERVKLIECWYRMPVVVDRMRGFEEPLDGGVYDPENEEHRTAVEEEIVSLKRAHEMKMHHCIITENDLIQDDVSHYNHNDFPLTPIFAFRRGRDNAPYGVVRNMRDAQRDYNARASKALFILSVNQIIGEIDAVEDWEEVREQAADPQGIIRLIAGAGAKQKRFDIINDKQLAGEHLKLMDEDANYMQRASGVTDENLGQESNAISGKAILAKQNEGSVVTFPIFDNLHYAIQLQGEKQLSNIEQYFDAPKELRIIGENTKHRFERINWPEFDPITGTYVIKNDMTADQSDFILDTVDFRQTFRQAQAEMMMEQISHMPPELAIQLLDLAVDMMDMPNKEEWVKRIRMMNGHTDPDERETEEQMAEREQKEAEEIRMKEIEDTLAQAQIDKAQADTRETQARADKLIADVANKNVNSINMASEAAATMATIPAVAPITDSLLDSAGFVDHKNVGAIPIPQPIPQIEPTAALQAEEHKNPTPKVDPNQIEQMMTQERISKSKSKENKQI